MAIIFNNQQGKSELQQRITAELREKQMKSGSNEGEFVEANDIKTPDFDAEHSEYTKNFKTTTSLAWAWALIVAAALGVLIWIVVIINR